MTGGNMADSNNKSLEEDRSAKTDNSAGGGKAVEHLTAGEPAAAVEPTAAAAARLAELIRIPTVSSYNPEDEDELLFKKIPGLLEKLYPNAHAAMSREIVGDRAIVYRWEGHDPEKLPVLGLAHYDVVPAGDKTAWKHKPFSGEIIDGRIYGRGTLDDKGMLVSWMEAVERLSARGIKPQRTVYLAFGGDEETTGVRGARKVASLFEERGLRFSFILDEGGAVAVDQLSAFTKRPVALFGCAEKGYLTLKITAQGSGGHASAPPKHSAVGRLSQAVAALEASPFPMKLTSVPEGMLRALGQDIGGAKGFVLRHPRLFLRTILANLGRDGTTASMVRTTLAPTVLRAGERDNVLPETAEASVNIRILPGETVAGTVDRVKKIIDSAVDSTGDSGVDSTVAAPVNVTEVEGSVFEPVPAGPMSGPTWNTMAQEVKRVWPEAIVAPYLMTATTDSRWYRNLSKNIYRFIPMEVTAEEAKAVHSVNESISIAAWEKSIDFLSGLLENLD